MESAHSDEGDGESAERGSRTGGNDRLIEALTAAVEGDVSGVPERLCGACVDLLDVTGASISLDGGQGAQALWWSSDEVAGKLAEAQYTLGDGPCRSALALGAPVLAADLTAGQDARRWPVFAQQAVALGVRAVFSLPLGASASAIGTLDLYRREAGALSERDALVAQPMSDAITEALLALSSTTGTGRRGRSWLDAAESDREEVHQATGMVMVHLNVSPEQALARLRAHAFAHGQDVTQAARDVLSGRVHFDD